MSVASPGQPSRAAFDMGGTFTDVVSISETGELVAVKVLSLPDRVGRDVRAVLPEDVTGTGAGSLRHASTVASNTVIAGGLAAVGLIATRGFRDVLEMRDQRRPPVIDAAWVRPDPLVPRERRLEVDERILADGTVDRPLDPGDARAAIEALRHADVQAIAVCLINSYVNDAHERLIARLAAEHAPGIPTCVSSDGFAVIREYERASTVTLNAALIPPIRRYLDRLEEQLESPPGDLLVMKSDGSMMSSRAARSTPARMIESGPAAGVLAAASYARAAGLEAVVAFDMGGTTAKASLIEHGSPESRPRTEVGAEGTFASRLFGGAGHIVAAPSLDIAEVGAGGGSIAAVGADGALHVGPHGAGAEPGPVCYGRGGTRVTVTDANVVLGYISPVAIAGGTVPIDHDAAARAIQEQIADPLGLDLQQAALGIVRIADATMLRAIRSVSVERGHDVRGMTLIAYGGSGPAHAARLADVLGLDAIHIPELCGLFSAIGLLIAERQNETTHSAFLVLDELRLAWTRSVLAELHESLASQLQAEGLSAAEMRFCTEVDLQHRHEQATLTVPLSDAGTDAGLRSALADAFDAEHLRRFGFRAEESIYLTGVRIRGTLPAQGLRARSADGGRGGTAPTRTRTAYFADHGAIETPVCARADVDGAGSEGPLLVDESDTVVVVPPGWGIRREGSGALVLQDRR